MTLHLLALQRAKKCLVSGILFLQDSEMGAKMAIGNVVQRGSVVYLYDDNNHVITSIGLAGGELKGYTGSTVNIRRGNVIYTYDKKGRQIGSVSAK